MPAIGTGRGSRPAHVKQQRSKKRRPAPRPKPAKSPYPEYRVGSRSPQRGMGMARDIKAGKVRRDRRRARQFRSENRQLSAQRAAGFGGARDLLAQLALAKKAADREQQARRFGAGTDYYRAFGEPSRPATAGASGALALARERRLRAAGFGSLAEYARAHPRKYAPTRTVRESDLLPKGQRLTRAEGNIYAPKGDRKLTPAEAAKRLAPLSPQKRQQYAALIGAGGLEGLKKSRRYLQIDRRQKWAVKLAPALAAFDIAMRPLRANAAATQAAYGGGTGVARSDRDIFEAWKAGLAGKKHVTGADMLKDFGITNPAARAILGTLAEVKLDPLTYVTGGFGRVATKASEETILKAAEKAAKAGARSGSRTEARVIRRELRERSPGSSRLEIRRAARQPENAARRKEAGERAGDIAREQEIARAQQGGRGIDVRFMGQSIPGVRPLTSAASRSVRAGYRKGERILDPTQRARTRGAKIRAGLSELQATSRHPGMTPEEFAVARAIDRTLRATEQSITRQGQQRAGTMAVLLAPGDWTEILHAIEAGDVERLIGARANQPVRLPKRIRNRAARRLAEDPDRLYKIAKELPEDWAETRGRLVAAGRHVGYRGNKPLVDLPSVTSKEEIKAARSAAGKTARARRRAEKRAVVKLPGDAKKAEKELAARYSRIGDRETGAHLRNITTEITEDGKVGLRAEVFVGNRNAGFIRREYDPKTRTITRDLTNLSEPFRQRGIGTGLGRAEEALAARGAAKRIETVPVSPGGEALARKLGGFEQLPEPKAGKLGEVEYRLSDGAPSKAIVVERQGDDVIGWDPSVGAVRVNTLTGRGTVGANAKTAAGRAKMRDFEDAGGSRVVKRVKRPRAEQARAAEAEAAQLLKTLQKQRKGEVKLRRAAEAINAAREGEARGYVPRIFANVTEEQGRVAPIEDLLKDELPTRGPRSRPRNIEERGVIEAVADIEEAAKLPGDAGQWARDYLESMVRSGPLVHNAYMGGMARAIAIAEAKLSLVGVGRPIASGPLKEGERIYRKFDKAGTVSKKGKPKQAKDRQSDLVELDHTGKDYSEYQAMVRGEKGFDPDSYVILNKPMVDRALMATDKLGAAGKGTIFSAAWDRLWGKWRTLALGTLQYPLRNQFSDAWSMYLGREQGEKTARNYLKHGPRTLAEARRRDRSYRWFEDEMEKSGKERGITLNGQFIPYRALAAEAEAVGAIRAGRVQEIYEQRVTGKEGLTDVKKRSGWFRRLVEEAEDYPRMATYIGARQRGLNPEQAAQRVADIHFDYGELTKIEQGIRRAAPFYTFTARNLRRQLQLLLTKPGRATIPEKVRQNALAALDGDLPDDYIEGLNDYEARQLGVPIRWGKDKEGRPQIYTISMGGPWVDLNDTVPSDPTDPKSWAQIPVRVGTRGLQLAGPWKMPIEVMLNNSAFYMDEIENEKSPRVAVPLPVRFLADASPDFRQALGIKKILDRRTGKKIWGWHKKLDYTLRSLMPGLPGQAWRLGQQTTARGFSPAMTAIGLTGVRAIPYDREQARVQHLQNQLDPLYKRQGEFNQAGINADHPTSAYERLSDRISKLEGEIDQLNRGRLKFYKGEYTGGDSSDLGLGGLSAEDLDLSGLGVDPDLGVDINDLDLSSLRP